MFCRVWAKFQSKGRCLHIPEDTHRGENLCLQEVWAKIQVEVRCHQIPEATYGENPVFAGSAGDASVRSQFSETSGHTGEEPYVCRECGEASVRSQFLLETRRHTGDSPCLWGLWVMLQCEVQTHQTPEERHRWRTHVCAEYAHVSVRSPISPDNTRHTQGISTVFVEGVRKISVRNLISSDNATHRRWRRPMFV